MVRLIFVAECIIVAVLVNCGGRRAVNDNQLNTLCLEHLLWHVKTMASLVYKIKEIQKFYSSNDQTIQNIIWYMNGAMLLLINKCS